MNTIELEKSLHLMGYWLNADKAVIDKMLSKETDLVKNYLKPFSKELNINLLSKDIFEAKVDLIKYYVFEFYDFQLFFKQYNNILSTGNLGNYSPKNYEHISNKGIKRKLDKFENYVVESSELFDLLFNEIQLCCIKYKIDFFRVCHELNFSGEYIDSGITLAHESIRMENLSNHKEEKKTSKIAAPVLGLFCSLINKIGINKREEIETATVYCKRICKIYNLPYTDRVRQNINVNETKRIIKELNEKVFPLIDAKTKSLIEKYLDNKHSPK